jgi:uncharacterized protein
VLLVFLTPFFFAFTAMALGAKLGFGGAALWLVVGSVLRLVMPKSWRRSSRSTGGRSRGGFFGGGFGGGGGGFGGGGFSGGGGSFGGGGASGSW